MPVKAPVNPVPETPTTEKPVPMVVVPVSELAGVLAEFLVERDRRLVEAVATAVAEKVLEANHKVVNMDFQFEKDSMGRIVGCKAVAKSQINAKR